MKRLILVPILALALAGNADAKARKKYKRPMKSKSARIERVQPSIGSYVLFDYANWEFDSEFNRHQIRSIASITKMFTAITVINSNADLYEKLLVHGHNGGKVPRGTMISRMDLLKAMVMNSDNLAAEVLANNHPGGFEKFLLDANNFNRSVGLMDTAIVDSSGLLPGNQSTATDLVLFLSMIKDNPVIQEIGALRQYELAVPNSRGRMYHIKFHNTNPELYKYDNIIISKTGFTNHAGRCVMMLVEKGQKSYALVVLGQPNVQRRSQIVNRLM